MKTVLIAGATGYLGRYAVQAFKHAGYRVRALARREQKLALPGAGLAPAISDCIDEIHIGDVTRPETLRGIRKGIDVVFSSVSLMGAKSKHTWRDVDYLGNRNILNEARKSDVAKFVFISVFNAAQLMHVPMVKAHEDFAAELAASGLAHTVIRPTGYFSDLGAFLQMAQYRETCLVGPLIGSHGGRWGELGEGKAELLRPARQALQLLLPALLLVHLGPLLLKGFPIFQEVIHRSGDFVCCGDNCLLGPLARPHRPVVRPKRAIRAAHRLGRHAKGLVGPADHLSRP